MSDIQTEELDIKQEDVPVEEDVENETAATEEAPQPETEEEQQPATAEALQLSQTSQNNDSNVETTLNPLNEPESQIETEVKGKNRRYWTPKEEERFFEVWGRENWRLTKHGKNTIFFAKWAEEMKEKFNVDVKPEEVQCKVNQTRAKFRQVKRLLETDRNAVKWKKFDLVEKILKNQYRSKDDEPVPVEAMENNRDMSPTEMLKSGTQPSSPNGMTNAEQAINLNQSTVDPQLTDEISLSDHNLTSNVFSNNSHSSNSFSTELFGIDQMDIKQEIETDLKRDGFSEFISINPNEQTNDENPSAVDGQMTIGQKTASQQELPNPVPTSQVPSENATNILEVNQNIALINNRIIPIQNHTHGANLNNTEAMSVALANHTINNHGTTMPPMQPPRPTMTMVAAPRKRNRASSITTPPATNMPLSQDILENMYLEEIKKKNVILVEQGEINRKRLRLEERKVKLMEEFFPKYLTLQQEILKKLDNVAANVNTPDAINIRIEE